MRNSRAILLGLSSLLAIGVAAARADVTVTRPYQGITYITRTETSPRTEIMHIVQVDLTAPGISFSLTAPGGSLDTVRQTTLNYLNQQHAQVAVNGCFFLPFPSNDPNAAVVGFAASAGNIFSPFEPQPIAPGFTNQSYAIVPFAPAINIDANNHAGIVHLDPSYADDKHVLENVSINTALSGSAQIVTNGVNTVPVYQDANHPNGLLTSNGTYSNSNSWYSLANARTVIGLSQDDETLTLFTVDKAGGSGGMSLPEIANLLVSDCGVYNALNLDGGGSTTLAMADPNIGVGSIMNVSADNPLGRAVGDNLAVFAEPVPEPVTIGSSGAGALMLLARRRRSSKPCKERTSPMGDLHRQTRNVWILAAVVLGGSAPPRPRSSRRLTAKTSSPGPLTSRRPMPAAVRRPLGRPPAARTLRP